HTIHAGFAPNSISGYVYDADTSEPIEGAAVVVWDYEQSSPLESPPEDRATTDSLGYYTTSTLPDGEYRVAALATGHAVEFYSETFGWNMAQPVSISGQSISGIDFTLGPGGTISGTITDAETGQPLSQVSLLVRFADGSPGGLVTTTGENGNYIIRGLPYGTYVIQSPAPLRLGPGDSDYITEFWQEKYSQEDADILSVTEEVNPSGINFILAIYIEADIDIKPESLNLKSKSDKNAVTAYIELPTGYDVSQIDVSSVMMDVNSTTVAVQLTPTAIGDYDEDGVADLMVKFNRQDVINALDGSAKEVTLLLTGPLVDGTEFRGEDTVRLIIK
ncbi:MAG: carboxypeptidase regulatory-like domain-containing protein, partial [Chloroflexota bacterium]